MRPDTNIIPIHEIKPLMEVPDNSLTFLIIALIIVVSIASGIIYLVYRHLKAGRGINQRKKSYKALQNIDFSHPKKAAYEITYYGRIFSEDSQRLKEAYQNLLEYLERYKYKKEVDLIDDESMSYYKIYLEMVDV